MTIAEIIAGLEYIAESPDREHGGFHPEAAKTAAAAIAKIEQLQAALQRIATDYPGWGCCAVARKALELK